LKNDRAAANERGAALHEEIARHLEELQADLDRTPAHETPTPRAIIIAAHVIALAIGRASKGDK
jgi:hypothetical protein